MLRSEMRIEGVKAAAFRIPTDQPEADGTLSWDSTTLVVVEVRSGGRRGLGYTYSSASIVGLLHDELAPRLESQNPLDVPACFAAMQRSVRNLGRAGLVATAISALDVALWDLKARLLDLPLVSLLGCERESVPIYGSGGFTSYDDEKLAEQLAGWAQREGARWVKMKVGSEPERDAERVEVARRAIGDSVGLFVDANGAYQLKQALDLAEVFQELGVLWYEEPVSSDDLEGLKLLRARSPACMEIAAGEYGYTLDYFRRMLESGAVDVQQADATRCGGITGFLRVASLCEAHHRPLSSHCAPALHLVLGCVAPQFRHLEWFHDHVRIEQWLFDGAPQAREGRIQPDLSRPGLGLEFKWADAERYRIAGGDA